MAPHTKDGNTFYSRSRRSQERSIRVVWNLSKSLHLEQDECVYSAVQKRKCKDDWVQWTLQLLKKMEIAMWFSFRCIKITKSTKWLSRDFKKKTTGCTSNRWCSLWHAARNRVCKYPTVGKPQMAWRWLRKTIFRKT